MALRALGSFPPRGSAELKQVWLCSRLQRRLVRCLLTIALPWWRCKAYFDRLSQNEDNKEKEFSKASIVSVWLDGEVIVSLR